MNGVLRVLGVSVANDAKLFRTPQFTDFDKRGLIYE